MIEGPQPPLLEAVDVVKTYRDGDVQALRGVSLQIPPGEYAAIMGPSGSGKSTLLNVLGALDQPTSGEVRFGGRPLREYGSLDRFRAQRLGFVFQSFHLLSVLSAAGNVQVPMFAVRTPAARRRQKARELLETVGLGHRLSHRPPQLSVGERQRVAIARALANDPELLLADEPTGNLDSTTAAGIFDLFDQLHERGMTIVLITHDPTLAARARRAIHMRDGQIESDQRVKRAG